MPTYGYRCPSCGHEFEKFEKITAKPKSKCPQCGKRAGRVISGGVGLVFKGSGFYITDYKRAGDPKAKESGETGDAKTEKAEKPDQASKPAKSEPSSKPSKAPGAES